MDIDIIQDTIYTLENTEITLDTIHDLASLYIVRDKLLKGEIGARKGTLEAEINDILPSYMKYKEQKIQYQLNNIPEETIIISLNLLCQEINEMITMLYSCTEMYKERKCIKDMLTKLYKKFVESV